MHWVGCLFMLVPSLQQHNQVSTMIESHQAALQPLISKIKADSRGEPTPVAFALASAN